MVKGETPSQILPFLLLDHDGGHLAVSVVLSHHLHSYILFKKCSGRNVHIQYKRDQEYSSQSVYLHFNRNIIPISHLVWILSDVVPNCIEQLLAQVHLFQLRGFEFFWLQILFLAIFGLCTICNLTVPPLVPWMWKVNTDTKLKRDPPHTRPPVYKVTV